MTNAPLSIRQNLIERWARSLKAGGFKDSLQEMEQAYLESKGFDNWSDYLASMGYLGNFEEQKQDFWKDFSGAFREPPTKAKRAVHYLATTSFGV